MSKDSHFTGQPVYSQVLKLLDKEKILILKFYQTVILLRLLLLHWLSDEHIIFFFSFSYRAVIRNLVFVGRYPSQNIQI